MSKKQKVMLVAMAIVVIAILVTSACCLIPGVLININEKRARAQCERWIAKASTTGVVHFVEGTDSDEDLGDSHYIITGVIEARSVDGITRLIRYTCPIRLEGDMWVSNGIEYSFVP